MPSGGPLMFLHDASFFQHVPSWNPTCGSRAESDCLISSVNSDLFTVATASGWITVSQSYRFETNMHDVDEQIGWESTPLTTHYQFRNEELSNSLLSGFAYSLIWICLDFEISSISCDWHLCRLPVSFTRQHATALRTFLITHKLRRALILIPCNS